jgi:type 1 fimbriae regulatory protein FimB/type 1 fimbriae regulatory protein FimE
MANTGKSPAKVFLTVVPSDRKVPFRPVRRPNKELRVREHLTPDEVSMLVKAAGRHSRYPARDQLLIRMMYEHGLRASEAVDLRWSQVDFVAANLHVVRRKNGVPSTHPLTGRTLRGLRKLQREGLSSEFIFVTERGGPFTCSGLAALIARIGKVSGIELKLHPHSLRHACGFYLASRGTDTRTIMSYLGHRSIQSSVVYTALSPVRFRGLFKD